MIKIQDLHLSLESGAGMVNILRGINLSVEAGQTVGVVGPSGSGKSTLMSVIAGLERPTSGEVMVAGHSLTDMNEDELALFRRHNLGIVFQSFHLIQTMTALENVAVPLELAGRRDAFERAEDELATVGLADRITHYPGQLSGGEQQRVALARAMVVDPKLVLADEPTGNLDGETGHVIIDLMFELHARQGTTLLLITHDPELAKRCNRVVHLANGMLEREESGLGEASTMGDFNE